MDKITEYKYAQIVPLSVVIVVYAVAVKLLSGYQGISLAVNMFHLVTLLAAVAAISTGLRVAVAITFLAVNVLHVFTAGLVFLLFKVDLSFSLTFYYIGNAGILLTDTVAVLGSVPAVFYAALSVPVAGGIIILCGYADSVLERIYQFKKIPVVYILLFVIILAAGKLYSASTGQGSRSGSFRGVDFSEDARRSRPIHPGFMKRYGYNISATGNIVFIILEGVSAAYFDTTASKHLGSSGNAFRAEHFFVPTPHTTLSIYSLLTGRYGDYRSRQRISSTDTHNSIPGLMRGRGYGTYFLYSGPTYFEGLHEMLSNFGFTIINKEKLEQSLNPATGQRYSSFNWGVDDVSLVHESAKILSREKEPGLFFIGLSSTHSPYFNPDPARFCRFDNNTAEGRYRNSIDYCLLVIDMLIDTFMQHDRDTLFIILGDHGESFGHDGYSKHGFSLYNTEISVPFIMLHRSFEKNMSQFRGSILDVYPSLADMTGLEPSASVDGASMFASSYILRLFLSSWRDGESRGLVLRDKKWIFNRRTGALYEMDLDDRGRIDLSSDPHKDSFLRFLVRQY